MIPNSACFLAGNSLGKLLLTDWIASPPPEAALLTALSSFPAENRASAAELGVSSQLAVADPQG